jgi:translation initiation factor 2B subunit (eIF-2B alpha/beta/delta family)
VNEVIRDIQLEFVTVEVETGLFSGDKTSALKEEQFVTELEEMSNRVAKLEETVVSLMGLLKQILSLADVNKRLR